MGIAQLMSMAIKLDFSRNELSKVFAVDSFQFREAKMIIPDTVKLGFVDNENRMNVACTRAMQLPCMTCLGLFAIAKPA